MAGVGVVLLVVTLAAIAALIGRPPAEGRERRRRPAAAPSWIREPPPPRAEAERRASDLLRSVVNPDEWEMYRDLGFICVTGRRAARAGARSGPPRHRYLVYPHLPVVALLPRSLAPVREYCVQFPDRGPGETPVLPAGDDVLAKWMTLRADEDRLLSYANVADAGCQVPLARIERDLRRLERWEAARSSAAQPQPQKGGSAAGAEVSAGAGPSSSAVSSSIRF